MNNLLSPAFPLPVAVDEADNKYITIADVYPPCAGFTKLEMASLMIAQGMLAAAVSVDIGVRGNFQEKAIIIAKAVLEEANK